MRRKFSDVPGIAALCNARKTKHVLTKKIYSDGVLLKGNVLALYRTSLFNLNKISQINFHFLSKTLIKKSAIQLHCFSRPNYLLRHFSFYFVVHYKPINKNSHETDAFEYYRHFCAF